MSLSQNEPSSLPALSRFFFALLLILCFAMIGATGYVKAQLDRAESQLAAPDTAFTAEQNIYQKAVIELGYGGFLGSAQKFMNRQDRTALDDMRAHFKTAQDIASHAAETGDAATRRDIQALLEVFEGILSKAEGGDDALSSGITPSDLVFASNALTLLDSKLQAATAAGRLTAQDMFQNWSFALTLLAYAGLMLAGIMTVRTSAAQRRGLALPLESLTQSVTNMIHGDLQNPIWGMERNDEIGHLARALDNARLYFAQLPDLSILDEDGAMRVKFEGESRSIFRELTQAITSKFEQAQTAIQNATGTLGAQQETISSMTNKMNLLLNQVQQSCTTNDATIKTLSKNLADASVALAQAQDKSATQIAKIVPTMQDRAQKMAEITQLAGTQIAQSLKSVHKSEQAMQDVASRSQQTVQQLSNATNQMGERMFAALNLMQASGKLLHETTDGVANRLGDAAGTLLRSEEHIQRMIHRTEERLALSQNAEENMAHIAARAEASADKMEKAVNAIHDRHEMLGEQVVTAAHRMESIVASFDSAQRSMTDAVGHIRRDGSLIANLLQDLRTNNEHLLSALSQNSQTGFAAVQGLAEKSHALMQRLEVQIQTQAKAVETRIDEISAHSHSMSHHATNTTSALAQAVAGLKGEQERLASTRSRFSETLDELTLRLEQHATSTFGKTEQWAAQSFVKLTTLAEQMESVMQRLGMLGQLTGTLGAVAGQLGQIVPTLTQYGASLPAPQSSSSGSNVIIDMEGTKDLIVQQTESVIGQLHEHWHKAVLQIEAMHDQIAQLIVQQKDQLETRLVVMDKKLREATEAFETVADVGEAEEKQTEIMNELVSAMARINEHVLELDDVIEDAGLMKKGA